MIPITLDPLLLSLFAIVFIIVVIILVVTELSDWLRQRSFIKELKKNPELYQKYLESKVTKVEKKKVTITQLIPKKVKVIVLRDESQLEDICTYDGEVISCKRLGMLFYPPENYKPKPSLFKKRIILTYYFDDKGIALDIKPSEVTSKINADIPDPRMSDVIINKRLIYQIFARLGINLTAIVTGMGLGCMIMVVIIFVLLPILGIPIVIGKQPIEVIHVYQNTTIPPAGNYTIQFP